MNIYIYICILDTFMIKIHTYSYGYMYKTYMIYIHILHINIYKFSYDFLYWISWIISIYDIWYPSILLLIFKVVTVLFVCWGRGSQNKHLNQTISDLAYPSKVFVPPPLPRNRHMNCKMIYSMFMYSIPWECRRAVISFSRLVS